MTKKPIIVSEININGRWVNQDDLPKEMVRKIVFATIQRAAKNIGFQVIPIKK